MDADKNNLKSNNNHFDSDIKTQQHCTDVVFIKTHSKTVFLYHYFVEFTNLRGVNNTIILLS